VGFAGFIQMGEFAHQCCPVVSCSSKPTVRKRILDHSVKCDKRNRTPQGNIDEQTHPSE
jgi:hypothetical protein